MLVLGYLVASLVTSSDSGAAGLGLCWPLASEPKKGGRIEGHVRWEDQSPRANVEIRASTDSGEHQMTTSDSSGAYALEVADDVFMEFRDPREHVGAACYVRPVPSKPATVDVRLGPAVRMRAAGTDLGCQVPSGIGQRSWTWVGNAAFVDRKTMFGPASEGPPDVRVDLATTDIEATKMTPQGAVLRLTPAATKRLRTFLNANVGKVVVTSIAGVPALRAAVSMEFGESGPLPVEIQASALSPDQRRRLCELLKGTRQE